MAAPAPMYAPWITAVLQEIETLASSPNPPHPLAISKARARVANFGADSPRPVVTRWENIPRVAGVGISLDWEGGGIAIQPNGGVLDCTNG